MECPKRCQPGALPVCRDAATNTCLPIREVWKEEFVGFPSAGGGIEPDARNEQDAQTNVNPGGGEENEKNHVSGELD